MQLQSCMFGWFRPEVHGRVKHACREMWMGGLTAHQAHHMPSGPDGAFVR
jgi:hypothetical protein